MKNKSIKIIAAFILALLLVPMFAVSAQSQGAARCVLDITYDEYEPGVFYWFGTLSDCDLAGTIRFDAVSDEYTFPGHTMHFVEEFTLHPYSGGEIKGKNWGVWNLATFKYRANGWIRETSPEWSHLLGAKYHEMGTTSPYYGNPEDLPITTAPGGKAIIAPGNRQPHALP